MGRDATLDFVVGHTVLLALNMCNGGGGDGATMACWLAGTPRMPLRNSGTGAAAAARFQMAHTQCLKKFGQRRGRVLKRRLISFVVYDELSAGALLSSHTE